VHSIKYGLLSAKCQLLESLVFHLQIYSLLSWSGLLEDATHCWKEPLLSN